MSYSARVAGMAPLPVHWNRPAQSPVWQCPVPWWNTQPVRPQNRPFQWLGTVMVRVCPGGSTQPVAASGCAGFCAAATQTVWRTRLTNVTWCDPDPAPAACSRRGRCRGRRRAGRQGGRPAWCARCHQGQHWPGGRDGHRDPP